MNEIEFRDAVFGIVFQRKFTIKRANKKTFIFFEIYWYKTTLTRPRTLLPLFNDILTALQLCDKMAKSIARRRLAKGASGGSAQGIIRSACMFLSYQRTRRHYQLEGVGQLLNLSSDMESGRVSGCTCAPLSQASDKRQVTRDKTHTHTHTHAHAHTHTRVQAQVYLSCPQTVRAGERRYK